MAKSNGSVEIKITGDDSELQKTLSGAKGEAEKALGAIGKGAKLTAGAVAAIGTATMAAGTAVLKVGGDFETAFAKVRTIMDPTQKGVEAIRDEILELSDATGIAAKQLSESVYNAISATGDTANSVQLVGSAVKLSKAGFTDTESALGVLTTAMNAYKLSADQAMNISDSLIKTQDLGVTTIAELSSVMGKAIASASAYGIDLSNVEASYISMTKAAEALTDAVQAEVDADGAQSVRVPVRAEPEISAEEAGEEVRRQAEAALEDAETGEPVRLAQDAHVDLNVTATVSGTDFAAAGADAGEQFAQGLAGVDPTGEAAGLAARAVSGLRTGNAAAQTLGKSFAQGYASGISSGRNAAISAAAQLAAAALRAVKNAQRSASPSKESRALGENFGQGYTIGIEESMREAISIARRMTGELINASAIGSGGRSVIRVEAGGEPLQVAVEGGAVPVNLDGRQIAEIQGLNNSSVLAFKNAQHSRGVGGR